MQRKKKLSLLLAGALLVTSIYQMPVSASDEPKTVQNLEGGTATADTQLSLNVKEPATNQGNSGQDAKGDTNLTLNVKEPASNQGNSGQDAKGDTNLTLNVKTPEANQGNTGKTATASTTLTFILCEHNWKYVAKGNKVYAYCDREDITCGYHGTETDLENALTLELTAKNTGYTGEAYTAATVKNEISSVTNKEAGEITYFKTKKADSTEEDGAALESAPSAEGHYVAEVTIGGQTAKAPFSISREFTSTEITAESYNAVYDGQEHSIKVKAPEGAKITYSETADGEYSATCPMFKDVVSETTVYFKVDKYGYKTYAGSATVTIIPRPITLSWDDTTLTYNGKEQHPNVTAVNVVAGEEDDCQLTITGAGKSVGTYTAAVTGVANSNYELSEDAQTTQEFTIEPKEIGIQWGDTDLIYKEGESQAPTAEATGLEEGDTCTITVTGQQTDPNPVDSPYTATAESIDNTNYKLPAENITSFTIVEDTVAPTLQSESGTMEEGSKYCGGLTFTVTDENLKEVTVDGTVVLPDEKQQYTIAADDKEHTIVATDRAKNHTTVTVAVYTEHSWKKTGSTDATCTEKGSIRYTCEYCGKKKTKTIDALGHNYSDSYTVDTEPTCTEPGSKSRHCSTCGDKTDVTEIPALGHTYGEWVQIVAPSGDSEGIQERTCSVCGYKESEPIPKPDHTHSYGAPSFTWADDCSSAKAVFTCESDATHVETVDCTVTSEETKPTCTVDGKTVYTAKVTFDGKEYTDTKETEQKAAGHKYGAPVFTWAEDNNSATAAFTCEADATHTETVEATITKEETKPTCTEAGKTVYTAKAVLDGEEYTDTKETEIPAVGHKFGAPKFVWGAGLSTATATFTCETDSTHTEDVDCTITSEVTKEPTETEKGTRIFTATAEKDGQTYTDTKEMQIESQNTEKVGDGTIRTEINVAEDVPKTSIGNLTVEIAKELLEKEELEQVEKGENVVVYLEATNIDKTVRHEDKTLVETKQNSVVEEMRKNQNLDAQTPIASGISYIDLSLYKKVGQAKPSRLTQTGDEGLKITIEVPKELQSKNPKRVYQVIRVHDGAVDILPAAYNGENRTLTFETDRFSTYAVTFAEAKIDVTDVKLDRENVTITDKDTPIQLTAEVQPEDASNKKVTWTSDDPSVAKVDETGKVTPVGNGTCTITATPEDGGKAGSCVITVQFPSEPSAPSEVPSEPSIEPSVPSEVPSVPSEVPSTEPSTPSEAPSIEPSVPSEPSAPSIEPSVPSEPSAPSIEPSVPSEPSAPSIEPSEPSEPSTPSIEPSVPSEPAAPSIEPSVPSEPSAPSKEPSVPSEEPTVPSEPSVEPSTPSEPSVAPSEPSKPSTPSKPNAAAQEKNALSMNAGLKVSQTGSTITVTWGKVTGADSYSVYVQYCGKSFTSKSVTTVKGTKLTITKVNGKKLDLTKNFKVFVTANQKIGSKTYRLGKTITAHIVGRKNTKQTNVKAIKLTTSSCTLKTGKTATIKAKTVLVDSKKKPLSDAHAKEFRYATSNKKVATVSTSGKIKAVKKGTCTIYVYARNGYAKKIKVIVK